MNKNEISKVIKDINKELGDDSIMMLGNKNIQNIDTFSSGSLIINDLLGCGGYPKGRIIEIFGHESSGKTTVALHAIKEVQKQGGIAAFIDAEHALDPKYAQNIGIKMEELILSQPNSGEQALEIVDRLVKTNSFDLIVVDSVAALVPEIELSGEMNDQTIGAQARLMSKALRKITGYLNKTKTTIIFINQLREKIGIMFGNPQITPGGRSLKFYASLRIEISRTSQIKDKDKIIGINARVKILKNKLSAPFKIGQISIFFSKGISETLEIITLAEKSQILQKQGSWYYFNNKNLAQGIEKLKYFLENNPETLLNIKEKFKL